MKHVLSACVVLLVPFSSYAQGWCLNNGIIELTYGGVPTSDLDLNGTYKLILDADGNSYWIGDTDDQAELWLGGAVMMTATPTEIKIPATATHRWDGRVQLLSTDDGQLRVTNSTDTLGVTFDVNDLGDTVKVKSRNADTDATLIVGGVTNSLKFSHDGTYDLIEGSDASGLRFAAGGTDIAVFDNVLNDFTRTARVPTRIYSKNSYIGLFGEAILNEGMTGMYDRTETSHAAYRGIVTVTVTGAGTFTDTVASKNKMFDGIPGDFFTITGTDATTTQVVIHIDLLANQANYSNAKWMPFIQYRSGLNSLASHFKTVTAEISTDNSTWYKPAGGEWETTDIATDAQVPGMWFGGNAVSGIPAFTYRYVRFTLTDRFENTGYAFKDQIWISQLGLRHIASPWSRLFVKTSGDTIYGNLDIQSQDSKGALTRTTVTPQDVTCNGSASNTTSALIPDGAFLIGISTRITTALTGSTGFTAGDGSDVDLYGVQSSSTQGATTNNASATATWSNPKLATSNVTLTWSGGSCTAGVVRVVAHYFTVGAPTRN